MNITLQTKIKTFPYDSLKVRKHPRNENGTTFFLDQPLSSNYMSTYVSKKMLIFEGGYRNLPVARSKYLIEFLSWNKLYFYLKFVVTTLACIPFWAPAPISENFPDTKMKTNLLLSL